MKVAFAGSFAVRLAEPVRSQLSIPCQVVPGDEDPHISGWTEGMLQARAKVIADNIERIARGSGPLNAISPLA